MSPVAAGVEPPRLSLARLDDEQAASVYQAIVFEASADRAIHIGDFRDVRLERMGRDHAVLALVSHWQPNDNLVDDADGEVDALRIHLRDPRWRRKGYVEKPAELDRRRVVDLHFAAPLAPGESYRLSWTCRPVDADPIDAHCEFSTLDIMREGENPDLSQTPVSTLHTYLCEVLVRDDAGNLFLGRRILPLESQSRLPLLSFDADGKVLEFPSDIDRLRRWRSSIRLLKRGLTSRPLPPLVEAPGRLSVSVQHDRRRFSVSGQCQGTYGSLPATEQDVTFVYFDEAIWRVQRWSENVMAFREDEAFWRARTAELHAEVVRDVADVGLDDNGGDALGCAAVVLRDPVLVRQLETHVRRWAEHKLLRDAPRWPTSALFALGRVGDETSIQTFMELQAKRPTTDGLEYFAWPLALRVGWPASREFYRSQLSNTAPQPQTSTLEILRKIDRAIPQRTWGDDSLFEMLETLKLSPTDYGLVLSGERLQAFIAAQPTIISASERPLLRRNTPLERTLIFPSVAARRAGIEKLLLQMETIVAERRR
jgi:hypothetical protein